ncbi:hypothetical protein B4135_0542 [Caldibacillus debilis]|uniref:Uncharacterized protein n=1 Tax=Caldibacillus debilis TaxID=301148 RepID=A0A150M9K2_9BACI|nr:hypothetical protein B4135_0542 [Caldibacillus debilis]
MVFLFEAAGLSVCGWEKGPCRICNNSGKFYKIAIFRSVER